MRYGANIAILDMMQCIVPTLVLSLVIVSAMYAHVMYSEGWLDS